MRIIYNICYLKLSFFPLQEIDSQRLPGQVPAVMQVIRKNANHKFGKKCKKASNISTRPQEKKEAKIYMLPM